MSDHTDPDRLTDARMDQIRDRIRRATICPYAPVLGGAHYWGRAGDRLMMCGVCGLIVQSDPTMTDLMDLHREVVMLREELADRPSSEVLEELAARWDVLADRPSELAGQTAEIITTVAPSQPRYHHTDSDGGRLLITTAEIPGQGRGVYFRTDPQGASVPLAELVALLDAMAEIGMCPACDTTPLERCTACKSCRCDRHDDCAPDA